MEYLSTRGEDNNTTFEGVLLNGLARDGGLYLPKSWPTFNSFEIANMRGLPYHQIAALIISKFTGDNIIYREVADLTKATYEQFTHPEVAPLKFIEDG